MSTILVTGGAGYVGSVCSSELMRQGHQVTILDNLSTGHLEAVPAGATFHRMDIGDRAAVKDLLKSIRFDAVFHFAAKALVPESVKNPGFFFEENVSKGIAFLETLRVAGLKKLIFSSSAAVYGNPVEAPILEDHPKCPVNAYGETKLVLEQTLRWYAEAYGWSVIAFRYFNAAGATAELGERHEPETHIIPLLLEAAAGERDFFNIYGSTYETPDGTCLRDYVHVVDIARAHICALKRMESPGMRSYNIGLGVSYSVRQVCEAVEKVVGHAVPIRVAERRPGDPAVLWASPERLISELGWKPQFTDLESIIATAWSWKQSHTKSHVGSGR